jgi:hypothetical protein
MGRFKELEIEKDDRAWNRAKRKQAQADRVRKLYEVISDGITVWVNGSQGNLARFGRNGIDIHRPPLQMLQKGECLYCTHEKVTAADWDLFVAKVKEHYGIEIEEQYRPDRFKEDP